MIDEWEEAEDLAAIHMQRIGYHDASRTGAGTDGGIDVASSRAYAQVKHWSTAVGAPEVQKLSGAAEADGPESFFYSQCGYTQPAINFADHVGAFLFQYDINGDVEPVSRASSDLTGTTRVVPAQRVPASDGLSGSGRSWTKVVVVVLLVIVGLWYFGSKDSAAREEAANDIHGKKTISRSQYRDDDKL